MDSLQLTIISLAVWRMTNLLVNEDGPRGILYWIRYKLGVRHNEKGIQITKNSIAEAFTCTWCLSVWLGIAATAIYLASPNAAFYAALPLAFSTITIILDRYING